MNKQVKGEGRGIEWTDYTWNPIAGCFHACAWKMPDGSIANCYAEDVANKVANLQYPFGFENHYYKEHLLNAPRSHREGVKIFCGSMADVFGHWVPAEQIEAVLQVCRETPQHTYQFLTKNPPRLKQFDFPANCWVGVSAPPSFMMGKPLTPEQQYRWFHVAVTALSRCNATVKWVSFEPLSFDIGEEMRGEWWEHLLNSLDWTVIGAASNGPKKYQPDPQWVETLIELLEDYNVPIFFKGNLRGNPAIKRWREEFPDTVKQLKLF